MKAETRHRIGLVRSRLATLPKGPQWIAFLPAIALAAFWLGGEGALLVVAILMPILFMLAAETEDPTSPAQREIAPADDVTPAGEAVSLADHALLRAHAANLSTACIVIEAEGLDQIMRQHGDRAAESLRVVLHQRLTAMLRPDDQVLRVGDRRFMVLMAPALRAGLEHLLQLAARLQRGLEEPTEIDGATHYVAASIGFVSSQRLSGAASGSSMIEAAQTALSEALSNGPSAIRAWSESLRAARDARASLLADVGHALTSGQIRPWFQPQVCTSTGRISGVEALARWIHPERGIVPPGQFLRLLEEAHQMDRLSEVMLEQSLRALCDWDRAGLDIPRVSINFSSAELRNPNLVERIRWELDRFGLGCDRLGLEVLETVIADSPDGVLARNIVQLGQLGCHVDLDDFGTGHASITALRRFKVHRLKIDRSFVTRIDLDEEQRRMLAAVLSMADRLELETLAEGVETTGEHALLAQLGCDHVQGFAIARPMPAERMIEWSRKHQETIEDARNLGRSGG
ncbi:putative bifunctional diguanylate cyclase/phosphodiesterase [Allosediminivita pacifica]|uniref:Diguanylate cyclase/phosphodiesterase n=1 Tax=Allosediminivita pacifica TaxID=1267769 RepID=A0A2T6AX21_9RHOB|nr:GGDEF domain-containing phosphodiesterase [Allosediminivita pacifica]PTX48365.1 diguanylate cyclase/phosphodiesterase [Allosediminivita pacifica]GGB11031.1 diguanylate cyclase [Allosediminivita pacifica]